MARILNHLTTNWWHLRRAFPPATLETIARTVAACEREHRGEIRVAVESCLEFRWLLFGAAIAQRAAEVFSQLRVWDTEENNGVLIYLLLAERHIEIIADRGYRGRVAPEEWQQICRSMEQEFRDKRFESGAVAGIRQVSSLIARHFPARAGDRNELPDNPVLLG